jgi:formylglycine-generating enzyme required for sulfatase activity
LLTLLIFGLSSFAAYLANWHKPKVVEVVREVPKEVIKEVPRVDPAMQQQRDAAEKKAGELAEQNKDLTKKLVDATKPPLPPRAEIVKEPSRIERMSTEGNSLGMRFIHFGNIPDKSKVLGCIHETRTRDYAAFMASGDYEMEGSDADDWKAYNYKVTIEGKPEKLYPVGRGATGDEADFTKSTHPVCNVSHTDAKAFCDWLTKKERAQGLIGPKDFYRLPTDHEWSLMLGIGRDEDPRATPKSKDYAAAFKDSYPWGKGYPPPADKLGNYTDNTATASGTDLGSSIPNYDDGYATTAPVMSYPANMRGFYDLGGNVWEWCEDWYDGDKGEQKDRVLRGAAWDDGSASFARSSLRYNRDPVIRGSSVGFRCVLVVMDG